MTQTTRFDLGNGTVQVVTWVWHPDREKWDAEACEIVPCRRKSQLMPYAKLCRRKVDKVQMRQPNENLREVRG